MQYFCSSIASILPQFSQTISSKTPPTRRGAVPQGGGRDTATTQTEKSYHTNQCGGSYRRVADSFSYSIAIASNSLQSELLARVAHFLVIVKSTHCYGVSGFMCYPGLC
jgi:hypothetical protein